MSQSDEVDVDEEQESEMPATTSRLSTETESKSNSVCVVSKKKKVSTHVSILVESLVKNICTMYETDPKKSSMMYKLICDKLFSMDLIDESYSMTEFEGMRSQYQRAFFNLVTSVKNGDKNSLLRPVWPNVDINSHYFREFDEIDYIAGGGFGQVYKVKHKLDGTEYAVKKIPIRSEGIESVRSYLSEVKTFASLNQSNIVQYKAAWLEIDAPSPQKAIAGNQSKINDKIKNTQGQCIEHTDYIYHKDYSDSFTDEIIYDDSSDFEIDFEHSINGTSSITSQEKRKREKKNSVSEGAMAVCKLGIKEIEKIRLTNKSKVRWATLYIQMALCQSTLKQWLEKRNSVSDPDKAVVHFNEQSVRTNTINQILIQLLKGLEYIHSKGIVHHDIKPSNIFLQIENNSISIQLGDFGLACPLQSVRHSLAFGTKLYAAPEQLAGRCNPKSDMYSLGIVLFELVENFRTDMERVEFITELRKGHISPTLLLNQPELTKIIKKLVLNNPDERPDTTTLLNILRPSEAEQIEQLKLQIMERDEEILHLKELLKSHGIKSV